MSDPNHESSSSARGSQGPGRLVRQAREQARLSLDDLAAQIKLARQTLDAIERDDFAQLNEPVYVRGYYRKLAKVLPVAESELLAAYDSVAGQKAPPHPSKLILAGGADWGGARQFNFKLAAAVVGLGLLIGVLLFLGSRRGGSPAVNTVPVTKPHAATTMPPVSLVSQTPKPAEPTEMELRPGADAVAPSTTPPLAAPAASASTATAETAAPAPSQPAEAAPVATAAVAGEGALQLQFTGTSWAEVKDASGKVLLSGLVQSGNTQSLEGRAPFTVTLGNAPVVQVIFNGKPVEMAQYRRGDNTARFTLQ